VIKDREATTRAIEFKAKLGKIADQLQPGTRVYKQHPGKGWIAKVGYHFEETEARAPTMAEALAALWLMLQELAGTGGK
jgi:hypothetical protein